MIQNISKPRRASMDTSRELAEISGLRSIWRGATDSFLVSSIVFVSRRLIATLCLLYANPQISAYPCFGHKKVHRPGQDGRAPATAESGPGHWVDIPPVKPARG